MSGGGGVSGMDGSLKALTRDEILVRVRALMAERFEVDPARVNLETRLVEDLDLDSIDAIDMAVELQGWTGVPLAEEALRAVRTVDDVITMIEAHLAKVTAARAAEAALGSDAATETSGGGTASNANANEVTVGSGPSAAGSGHGRGGAGPVTG